ncbi:MAG: putative tRNA sulfurtransferase [candidate division BRC1 bacterium ADurb.BinA364]|nr:MAG: putative tRNA sulfurtransferase [candidate division BRC1 bacterium ADurb.BinA364]
MTQPAYDTILCRYSEIGLKGGNRGEFEERLTNALRRALRDVPGLYVINERGRLFIRPKGGEGACFSPELLPLLRERLPRVFGLSSASLGLMVRPEMADIEAAVLKLFPAAYADHTARHPGSGPIQYCTRVRRSWKEFPLDCRQVEIHFAEKLLDAYPRLEVNLKQPELCVEIEIRRKRAMVLYDRIAGPGGLPAGCSGRALALLSGGIDSPVACSVDEPSKPQIGGVLPSARILVFERSRGVGSVPSSQMYSAW